MKNLTDYMTIQLSDNLAKDVMNLLETHGYEGVGRHSRRVAEEAKRLCQRFGESPEFGEVAGWLHDISVIIPNGERIELCQKLGLSVYQEERELPMILHQRLSKEMARDLFEIKEHEILKAIECHTTLRQAPSKLDLIVFIADKIQWDQEGQPPYLNGLLASLEHSLEEAALFYIEWLLASGILVEHPWLMAAHSWLIK